ncbi:MAG: PEP-CTERM sorting domain-containing protein [Alphaproteobacteria bacterium]
MTTPMRQVLMLTGALLALPAPAMAGAIVSNVITDTTSRFEATFTHATPVADHVTVIGPLGVNWRVDLTVTEDSTLDDELDITATLRHIIPPHGEGQGPLFTMNWPHIDAGDFAGGAQTVNANILPANPQPHGSHQDEITTASVTFTVDAGVLINDIDNFVIRIAARHIPEPSTLVLLGAGLAGLGLIRRRRARG